MIYFLLKNNQVYSYFCQNIISRCILIFFTSLFITFLLGPSIINKLLQYQIKQVIRLDGPNTHLKKFGTPTMGGILILLSVIFSNLIWSDCTNLYIQIILFTMISFGIIGLYDDYLKMKLKNSHGLLPYQKFFFQTIFGLAISIHLFVFNENNEINNILLFPFFKNISIYFGLAYIFWVWFIIVGFSNAVNLTDGLDGLAIVPIIMITCAFSIFAYISNDFLLSNFFMIPYIPMIREVPNLCSSIIGAGIGFLWFNTYPAKIFMGDVGALGLGAALGIISILIKQEILLIIMGGIFVSETLSVIIQVIIFKIYKIRLFKMAPLHHHFELKKWPEPRIIVRFWIITFILVLIGIFSLNFKI